MDIGLLLNPRHGIDTVELAVEAEKQGFDAVWFPELWGPSAPVMATAVAEQTTELTVGTAILNVFSRTPATLAMTADALSDRSGGRFVLGLGTSTRMAIEGLHDLEFERPVRRAHETIELVRALTAGEDDVDYAGDLFEVASIPPLGSDVRIFGAALGEANRRMVGRLCDGWIPHNIPFPTLPHAFETVAEAARDAGRDPASITIAPYVPTAVSPDLEKARNAIRSHVAYYVGSGEGYRRAVGESFPEHADTIATRWHDGERSRAAAAVTDTMVDALGVASTPTDASEDLEDLCDVAGIDSPIVVVPEKTPELVEPTIEALGT